MRRPAFLRGLARDRRGASSVEFALSMMMVLSVVLIGLDFGVYVMQKKQLWEAISRASLYAMANSDSVTSTQMSSYVQGSLSLPGTAPTVNVTCNGSSTCVTTGRTCSCLTVSAGGTPSFTSATCSTSCGNGSRSGYFMTVTATYPYRALFGNNPALSGRIMAATTTTRLQ